MLDRAPPMCPRHPLYAIDQFGCAMCARELDECPQCNPAPVVPGHVGYSPDYRAAPPAPVVPPLGRVHARPPRPAPAQPGPSWRDVPEHHRASIVGMLAAAEGTQRATARVMRAGHLATPERITDTETRGEAYAAAVERLRDLDDESTIAGLRRALIAASTEIERLEAIEMPVDAEQAFERGWDARADATLRGAGRHVVTIREALAHELLRGNLATFAATYDRDAEAYDERAAACGSGPDHDRHRGNAERSRAAARLYRAVLAIGTPLVANVPHAESVAPGEAGGQTP